LRRCRPIPGLIIIIILVFQFPVEKELEILAIDQGLIVLWPSPEVPFLCILVERSTGLMSGSEVEPQGHLPLLSDAVEELKELEDEEAMAKGRKGRWCSCYRFEEGDGCTMRRCEVK
jgi:hypothetical protein